MRSNGFISLGAVLSLVLPAYGQTNATINSQVHLAYAGDTGMVVSWNTFTQVAQPTVMYGLSASELNLTASSNVSVTYPTSLTFNNHVTITGLQPDTLYFYSPVGILTDNSTTLPYSFRTSRPAGDGTPYAIAVVVDMGTMGPQGLTTFAGEGVPNTTVLAPGENNTIQSLEAAMDQYEFIWHRRSSMEIIGAMLIPYSW
jgi:acid phosphatase type 7